jgi:hypothetical protein
MKFDPKLLFWLQFAATVGQGLTSGAVHLTGLVPMELVPYVTGWISFAVFVIMAFLTMATGAVGAGTGPLARPPTVAEARQVMAEANAAATGH